MAARFVALRNHSWFSLLGGVSSPEEMLSVAAAHGYEHLGLTDTNTLSAAPAFVELAHRFGVLPIIGARIEHGQEEATVLIADKSGWASASALISKVRRKDRMGLGSLLAENGSGLHVLVDRQSMLCAPLTDRFAKDERLWVEVLRPGDSPEEEAALVAAGKAVGAQPVASLGVRFAHHWQYPIYRLIYAIRKKLTLDKLPAVLPGVSREHHLATPEDAAKRFGNLREAADNTIRLARACSYDAVPRGGCPPPVIVEAGQDACSELRKLAWDAFKENGRHWRNEREARARLEREIGAVLDARLEGHVLILAEIARQAKANKWSITLRGSAAGSLLLYLLGLAVAEPVENGLLFERFLRSGRERPPDFDLQIADSVRADVWTYLVKRYKGHGVARIGLPIHFGPVTAWRHASVTNGLSYSQTELLLREIRGGRGERLLSADLQEDQIGEPPAGLSLDGEGWSKIVRSARALKGRPHEWRHHSSAILLTDPPSETVLPIEPGERYGTALIDKDGCALMGLIKIDLLSSGAATVIDDAKAALRDLAPDLAERAADMPDGDPLTLKLLASGDTWGIIGAQTPCRREMFLWGKPRSLLEVAQLIALTLPAAAGYRDSFLRRRAGLERPDFPHASCEDLLRASHGYTPFDDDKTRLIQILTGLNADDADDMRKDLCSEDAEARAAAAERFTDAVARNRLPPEAAVKALPLLQSAGYGFCKAHALAQASEVWKQAWLKAHAPLAFWSAALRRLCARKRKAGYLMRVLVEECKRAGLIVLGPNMIYRPNANWTHEADGRLTAGLSCVRGVPEKAAATLLTARQQGGSFRDTQDLLKRSQLSADVCATFARAGCFSALNAGVGPLLAELKASPHEEPPEEPFPLDIVAEVYGEECIGRWRSLWGALGWLPGPQVMTLLRPALPADLDDTRGLRAPRSERKRAVRIAGLIAHSREANTRSEPEEEPEDDDEQEWEDHEPTRWLTLADEYGWVDVVVPPKAWPSGGAGIVLIVEGRVEDRYGVPVVIARRVSRPAQAGGDLLISQVEEEEKPTLSLVRAEDEPPAEAG